MTTVHLELDELAANQSQPHVTHNSAINRIDAIVQLTVITQTNTPPASPEPQDGDRYLCGTLPTGDWAGHANDVAAYIGGGWQFFQPQTGWLAYVQIPPTSPIEPSLYIYGTGSPIGWDVLETGGGGGATSVDLGMFFPGNPASTQLMFKFVATRAFTFPANFVGSYGDVGTNPNATRVLAVDLNGANIGSISISTAGAFTFTTTGGTTKVVAAGDVLTINMPTIGSPLEPALADVAATLVGAL